MTILRKIYKTSLLLAVLTGAAWALPEGASVTNGTVNIQTSGTTQTITQGSNKAIINWNGFNIDVGELVHFVQPSSISAILNRVIGQDPSVILGSLRANGQVFLINPNGVVFGQSANVDVGSLVVSTLNMTDDDFLAGNLNFSQEADKDLASVINHGTIKIDDNGFLVLTGPMVANDGVILARAGQVALAAGTQSTVSFDPTGMIQVALPQGSETRDGIVSLSQQAAGDILSGVVGTSATQAGQIVERDGRTFLEVESGTVVQAGEIVADGRTGADAGRVVMDSTANTILSAGSTVSASGVGLNSNGGEVFVLSDGVAESQLGSTIDIGGGDSGDGGFAEQSASSGVVAVQVDGRTANGRTGTFLIDPDEIIVESGAGGTADDLPSTMYVSEDNLEFQLSDILLQADDAITFETLDGGALVLQSNVSLTIDLMRSDGPGADAITFLNPGDQIVASGSGQLQVDNATGQNMNDLNLVTADGDIVINSTIGGDFVGATNFTTSGAGDILVNAAGSDFTGATTFTAGDTLSVVSNNVNLTLDSAYELSGTNTADVTLVADAGMFDTVQLHGVDTTGGSLRIETGSVFQSNQTFTNTGDFVFDLVGNLGTPGLDVRIDGSVEMVDVGSAYLEAVNSITLRDSNVAQIQASGGDFTIDGAIVSANPFVSLIELDAGSGGSITSTANGSITADNVDLTGLTIGTALEPIDVNVTDIVAGALSTTSTGDVYVNSTGSILLGDSTADFFTATGTNYLIGGNVAANSINIDAGATDITSLGGSLSADTIDLAGNSVGTLANPISVTTSAVEGNGLTVDAVDTIVLSSPGDLDGSAELTTTTGDITVTATGNFTDSLLLDPGARFDVSSGNVNLILNVLDQLTGTTSADVTVNASGRNIQLNGVDATGGLVTLISADVTQTNQGNVNQGDFSFSTVGDIGTMAQPLRVDGGVQAMLTGDLFAESVNELTLTNIDATNVNVFGDDILLLNFVGNDFTTQSVTLTSNSRIDGVGRFAGDAVRTNSSLADDGVITLSAPEIGTAGYLELDARTVNITANNADLDSRNSGASFNLANTQDPSLAPTQFFISDSGEGTIIDDDGTNLDVGGFYDTTLSIIGDRNFNSLGGFQDTSVTTVADSMGNGDLTGTLSGGSGAVTLTGENIIITDIALNPFTGPITLNANNGGVEVDAVGVGQQGPPPSLDLTATATTFIDVDVPFAFTSAGLTAPTVVLNADDINVNTATSDLTANSTSGDVVVNNNRDAALAFSSDAAGGSGNVTLIHTGELNTGNVTANQIDLTTTGGGSITSVGATTLSSSSFTRLVSSGGVDVNTTTTAGLGDELIVDAMGSVRVDNTASGTVSVDIEANGNPVTFNSSGGDLRGDLNGSSLTVTNVEAIDIDTDAAIVDATSTTEDLFIFLNAAATTVTASAVDPLLGNVVILHSGDVQVGAGGITAGTFVTFDSPSRNITGVGTVTAQGVGISGANDAQLILSGVTQMSVAVDGDIDLVNSGALSSDVLLASLSEGDVLFDNGGGDIVVQKAVAIDGNITLTTTGALVATNDPATVNIGEGFTPPGDTIAAFDPAMDDSGGRVILNADSIDANITAEEVTATAATGNIMIDGTESPDLLVASTSTSGTGDIAITNQGNIAANQITGNNVSLDAGSFAITQNSGSVTGTTVNLMADTITSVTETTDLTALSLNGDVNVTNTGNLSSAVLASMNMGVILDNTGSVSNLMATGDLVDLTATSSLQGSATGTTSVTANADSINLTIDTPFVEANATDGSLTLTSAGSMPLDVLTSATTTTTISHAGDLTGTLSGGTFADLDADSINVSLATGAGPASVSADAPVSVDITADQASLQINSLSTGDITVTNSGGDLVTQVVNGDDVTLTSSGALRRNGGGITATNLFVEGDTIDLRSQTSNRLEAISQGDLTITNEIGAPSTAVLASLGAGNIDFDAPSGDLTIERAFAANGNIDISGRDITATTDPTTVLINGMIPPGNTLSAPNGSITVNGQSADIQVTTSSLMATTSNGNLNITGTDNTDINIDASATNGNITINESGNVTGTLNSNVVDVTASSIDADLGAGVSTVLATSTAGLIDLLGNSPDLEVTAIAPVGSPVTVNNTGGNITTNTIQGSDVSVTASGDVTRTSGLITGATSVSLSGDNITATTDSPSINASSVSGDIDITHNSFGIGTITANLNTAGNVVLRTQDNTDLDTVSGNQVTIDLSNGALLTGTVDATTNLNLIVGEANISGSAPTVTGVIYNGDFTFNGTSGDTNFSPDVNIGDTTITHVGNVTGTLQGTTVDVTAANIDVATASPEVTATATAVGGTIGIDAASPTLEVTATADGDITIGNVGGRFGGGNILANTITSSNGNITLSAAGDFVRTNTGEALVGNLVTIDAFSVDVDTQATGLNITTSPTDFDESITVRNTGTDLDPVFLDSASDVFFTTDGNADNLNISGNNVNITVTDSFITGGIAAADGDLSITAGTVSALAVVTDTLVVDTTVGDANFTGTNANLAVSGTSAGGVSVVNSGNISTGQLNGTSISLDTQASGDITNTSGRLTTNGFVSLDGNDVSAQTEAGSLSANARAGNIDIDNFSAAVDPVTLTATGTVDFTTTGDANFANTAGTVVNLQADGALTGAAGASTSLALNGDSVSLNVVTPVLDVISATGFDVQGASADMTVSGSTSSGDAIVGNTGNIATDTISGDNVSVTSTGGSITRNGGALTTNPGGMVTLAAAQNITAETNSETVVANATAGNVTLDSNVPMSLGLSGSAGGNFIATQDGALMAGDITAGTIGLTSTGPLSSITGTRLTSDQVNLDGSQIAANTTTGALDARSDTSLNIVNNGRAITTASLVGGASDAVVLDNDLDINGVVASGQDITIRSSTGSVGTTQANATRNVSLEGQSVQASITGTDLSASATNGNIDITANSPTVEVQGTATGDVTITNTGGGLEVNEVAGQNVRLDTQNNRGIIVSSNGPGTITATSSAVLLATDITAQIITPDVTATTNGGDIALTGSNPNLTVTADAMGGDITVNNQGNLSTNNISGGDVILDTRSGGIPQGAITRTSGTIQATNLTLEGTSVTANTTVSTITANAPGDILITNAGSDISQANLVAGGNVGLITDGTANLDTFQGTGLTLSVAQAVTGSLVGNTIDVTGTDVNVTVAPISGTTTTVDANSTSGNVQVNGTTSELLIAASADNGSGLGTGTVTVTNTGNIATNTITGSDVSISANAGAGDITNSSGRITGTNSITLTGNDVTASTTTPSLTALGANTVTISNDSASLTPNLSAGGAVDLSSTGAITNGQISGSSLQISGQSIQSEINTSSVQTTSSGDTTLTSGSSSDLAVVDSTASNGDYTLNHQGNVNFDRIEAQNVTIDAGPTGNITDTSGNTIIATGITLTGNTILVNTQGQIITITAQGDVTVSNSLLDISSLTVDAEGNITFGTEGDLTITQVAGGPLVSLSANGNMNANSGAVVSGTDVVLEVGGQITPDLDNPLDVQASNTIEVIAPFGGPVLAQGGTIAAALEGSVPSESVLVSTNSGPVFYNGVLINPTSTTPSPGTPSPVTPPPQVEDQLGQQSGQVVDDGSVGSAANDGIVEQSPTQKLVAQLTEGAEGGGDGQPTSQLITLEIDELGDVQVQLGQPSPQDTALEKSEDMTADDILDLETDELTDVKVSVYYDSTNDQLVLAIDLRADDIIDLDVSEYELIPLNLDYSFLSDPRLIADKLRADDLIDLEVEDLGRIPIKVVVLEDEAE